MRTVYRASRVHTLAYPSTGGWILVDDRHVQRVGTGDPPEADRTVELPGATIIPGFVGAGPDAGRRTRGRIARRTGAGSRLRRIVVDGSNAALPRRSRRDLRS